MSGCFLCILSLKTQLVLVPSFDFLSSSFKIGPSLREIVGSLFLGSPVYEVECNSRYDKTIDSETMTDFQKSFSIRVNYVALCKLSTPFYGHVGWGKFRDVLSSICRSTPVLRSSSLPSVCLLTSLPTYTLVGTLRCLQKSSCPCTLNSNFIKINLEFFCS